MQCMYCRGVMERGTAPFHIDKKGYHLQFDAVPAWVCTQCGEAYFEEAAVASVQNIIQSIDKEKEKIAVAV